MRWRRTLTTGGSCQNVFLGLIKIIHRLSGAVIQTRDIWYEALTLPLCYAVSSLTKQIKSKLFLQVNKTLVVWIDVKGSRQLKSPEWIETGRWKKEWMNYSWKRKSLSFNILRQNVGAETFTPNDNPYSQTVLIKGVRHSTEVAFALLTQQPRVQFSAFPWFFTMLLRLIDGT